MEKTRPTLEHALALLVHRLRCSPSHCLSEGYLLRTTREHYAAPSPLLVGAGMVGKGGLDVPEDLLRAALVLGIHEDRITYDRERWDRFDYQHARAHGPSAVPAVDGTDWVYLARVS